LPQTPLSAKQKNRQNTHSKIQGEIQMTKLSSKSCASCTKATSPLTANEFSPLLSQLDNWSVVENKKLSKTLKFPDFVSALAAVNQIGELAEEENHHPDLFLAWGKVQIEIWTHSIGGLTEADFVLAAKIDNL